MLLNLLLTQLGFAIISIVVILSDHAITAIITVNVVFAIIITYITVYSMKRIVIGIERLKLYIDDLMDFLLFIKLIE